MKREKLSECEKGYRRWISPSNRPKHVFSNCNVCGRELVREDEFAVGMCAICANEEIEPNQKHP